MDRTCVTAFKFCLCEWYKCLLQRFRYLVPFVLIWFHMGSAFNLIWNQTENSIDGLWLKSQYCKYFRDINKGNLIAISSWKNCESKRFIVVFLVMLPTKYIKNTKCSFLSSLRQAATDGYTFFKRYYVDTSFLQFIDFRFKIIILLSPLGVFMMISYLRNTCILFLHYCLCIRQQSILATCSTVCLYIRFYYSRFHLECSQRLYL